MLRLTDTYKDAGLFLHFTSLHGTHPYKAISADLVRSRDPAILDKCDIVVDVGAVYDHEKKRYDHHQRGFEEVLGLGFNTKLSSAGLVYK